jgi:hypothetical protein
VAEGSAGHWRLSVTGGGSHATEEPVGGRDLSGLLGSRPPPRPVAYSCDGRRCPTVAAACLTLAPTLGARALASLLIKTSVPAIIGRR